MNRHQPPPIVDQLLSDALRWHEAGDLAKAERNYRQVLAQDPANADALHLLGLVAYQARDYDAAVDLIRRAVHINGRVPVYHNNLGVALQERGDREEAVSHYRRALKLDPSFAGAHGNLGNVLRLQGKLDDALRYLNKALALNPGYVDAEVNIGKVLYAQGKRDEAEARYRHAMTLNPKYADAYNSLGLLLADQERLEEALAHYRRALELRPDFPDAHCNLGNVLQGQGKLDEALDCHRRAMALNPRLPEPHINIGNICGLQGRPTEAVEHYRQALALQPDSTIAHNYLGVALYELGRYDEAAGHFRRALALDPRFREAHINLGDSMREEARIEEAVQSYRQALEIKPTDGLRLRLATLLPAVVNSTEDILNRRQKLEQNILDLAGNGIVIADPFKEVGSANFYLAYHGLNNRELQIRIARLYASACPSLLWQAPHCRRPASQSRPIRVGFISSFLRSHSIGKTTRGLMAQLARDRFRVYALFVPPVVDDGIARFIRAHCDETIELPAALQAARERIADLELDVLFYQDIGMEPFTYFLAFARLAPVQCVCFGHPDTTGIRNMDYFISNDLFETEGAEHHYSEQLFLLRDLPTLAYYYRPKVPQRLKEREAFGLPPDAHLYICPQTLFKFHPDFDTLLGDILRADPRGRLVLIEGQFAHWNELLRRRFARNLPDVVDRVMWLPKQEGDNFVNLLAVCDVMLDTLHFNGMNTSLEAFAVGTPVVTLPQSLQRSRHTFGMYKKMGIDDCTAQTPEEYVHIAVRLGTDREYRRVLRDRILAANSVLYENLSVVREFERFFEESVKRATGVA